MEPAELKLRSEMIVVVYCYLISTVAVYTVRGGSPASFYNRKWSISLISNIHINNKGIDKSKFLTSQNNEA